MEESLDFDDVLIKPTRTSVESRSEANLEVAFTGWKHATLDWSGIPICSSNSHHVGTFPVARMVTSRKMLSIIRKGEPFQDWKMAVQSMDANYLCPTIGIDDNQKQIDGLRQILALSKDFKFVCVQAENGYQLKMINTIKKLRTVLPNKIIIAGNVCSPEGVAALLDAGADIVKLGFSDKLRSRTGVGCSQLSTIVLCSATAAASGGYIMSDSGFSSPADISKAFGAGANFVCVTDMFTGHEECDGVTVEKAFKTGEIAGEQEVALLKKFKAFYSPDPSENQEFPYRGPVSETVNLILEAVAETCTMINCRNLKDMPRHVAFVRTTSKQPKFDLTNIHSERILYSVGVGAEKCNHLFPVQYKEGNLNE